MQTFYWYIAGYFISVFLCYKLLRLVVKLRGRTEDEERINRIIDIDKVDWYISWIPVYNIYLSYLCISDLFHLYSSIKTVKKLIKDLHEAHPDDPDITELYNKLFKIKNKH